MSRIRYLLFAGLLAALLAAGSGLASLVIPLGLGADEEDHLDYLLFLAYEKRLPHPGEDAVGQLQHPPLAYALLGGLWRIAANIDSDAGPNPDATAAPEHRGSRLLGRVTTFDPERRRIDGLGLSLEEAQGLDVNARTRAIYTARRKVFQWLRYFAVLLGFATFLLVALALYEVWPDRPGLALAATALMILTAQAAVGFATISNDPLSAFLGALTAYLALRARRRGRLLDVRPSIIVGAVLGLAFLTKLHAIGTAGFLTFLILGQPAPMVRRLRSLGLVAGLSLLIAGWWHIRQWYLLGSPLALQHHVDFQPALIRLGAWRPSTMLDYLYDLAFSFFGRFGQEKIETHALAIAPAMALVLVGLAGLFFPPQGSSASRSRRRAAALTPEADDASGEKRSPRNEEEPVAPRPLRAAGFAVLLLVGLIAFANRNYYHVHGRYMLAMLVPLAIAVSGGLERLLGRRATGLAGLGAVVGTVAAGMTLICVLLPRYSVPASFIDRGRVHRFIDAGNPAFDQLDAGGLTGVAPGGRLLSAAHDTFRWAPQFSPEPEIRYRIEGLAPHKRYQLRVGYPRPDGAGEGDLPAPSANALVADSWALHRAQSVWPELGVHRFEIPHPVTEDGVMEIWWQNHHPRVNAVGLTHFWIEESWLGVDETPRLIGRDVVLTLRNLDQESAHRAMVFVERGIEIVARWPAEARAAEEIKAEGRRLIRIPLPEGVPSAPLRVRIVDLDVSPQISLKLAHWRRDGIATGGFLGAPDLVTLRATPNAEAEQFLARLEAHRLFRGPHRLTLTFPRGSLSDDDPRLKLTILDPQGTKVPLMKIAGISPVTRYGRDLESMSWDFEQAGEGELSLAILLHCPAGEGPRFDLDRIIVERLPEHVQAGQIWEVKTR
jgi:hypothetical protein